MKRLGALGACAVLALGVGALRAEVALDDVQGNARVLFMITEGADPVGVRWGPVRARVASSLLNPGGDARLDGFPQLAWDPWGEPAVVWAFQNATHNDVAFSRGSSGIWTPIEFVSARPDDEVDPQLFIAADGVIHVVWWVDGGDPHVMLVRTLSMADGNETPTWLAPVRVNPEGELARRPSVALFGGSLRVAYERSGEVVVRREEPDGTFVVEHVFPSQSPSDLTPVLHADRGRVWLDWKYSATQFASSRFQGGSWGPTELHPWSDTSWVGIEGLRKSIGSRVMPAVQVAPDPIGGSSTGP